MISLRILLCEVLAREDVCVDSFPFLRTCEVGVDVASFIVEGL